MCTYLNVQKTKRTLIISITPHADFYQYIFGGDSPILTHQARRVIWWILRQEVTWFYHEMTIYSQITCWEWDQLGWIHPGRLTWNLRIHLWKRKIIFQTIIFRFYVNLPGCMFHPLRTWIAIHHHTLTADIECSGGRDIKALSKKNKNFQWPYTPETNGSHLPGGQSPKGKFLFQPKWGAKLLVSGRVFNSSSKPTLCRWYQRSKRNDSLI